MLSKTTTSLLAALILSSPSLALAKEAAPATTPASDWKFMVGAGAMVAPTYEGSEHYHLAPMPFAEVSWRNTVSLGSRDGLKVTLHPLKNKGFTLTTGIGYWGGRKQGADKGHGDALRGLGDISSGAVARFGVGYEVKAANVGLDFARDLSGDRDGTSVTLKGGYKLYKSKSLRVSAELSTTWADDQYMSSMFGITQTQASASVKQYSAYSASAGIKDVKFGFKADYSLTQSVNVFALLEMARLTGDAADSPIVKTAGDANQYTAGLGLMYHF